MDAVKRQSEQLVVAFLKAAANNERTTVDNILDEGAIEVDDSDGPCSARGSELTCSEHALCTTALQMFVHFTSCLQVRAAQHYILLPRTVTWQWSLASSQSMLQVQRSRTGMGARLLMMLFATSTHPLWSSLPPSPLLQT